MTVRAQDQLERLLLTLPHLAEDTPLSLHELAARVGADEQTLLADLNALSTRERDVAGFVESIELYLSPAGVAARTSFFKRPMRLTRAELAALDLGLGLLRLERPIEDRAAVDAVRKTVRAAAVSSSPRATDGPATMTSVSPPNEFEAEVAPEALLEHFGLLWHARDERRAVRIAYRRANAEQTQDRVVHPWAVVRSHQHLYVVGWCTSVTELRVFRLDRIHRVALDGDTFDVPADFDVAQVMKDGRIFSGERPEDELVVRYSSRIARWIAERERVVPDADGAVTVTWPLADDDWAVRHVLQYGPDATVIAPSRIAVAVCDRLRMLLAQP